MPKRPERDGKRDGEESLRHEVTETFFLHLLYTAIEDFTDQAESVRAEQIVMIVLLKVCKRC